MRPQLLRAIVQGQRPIYDWATFRRDWMVSDDLNPAGQAGGPITFTRASSATRVNAAGLVETVAAGLSRVDYDPVALARRGLLVEGAGVNLFLQSNNFAFLAWDKNEASVSASAATGPDGAASASKLRTSTATAEHSVFQSAISFAAGSPYTISVWAKAGEERIIFLSFNTPCFGSPSPSFFDLLAGIPTAGAGVVVSMEQFPNGWYRCIATKTATGTGVSSIRVGLTKTTSSSISTGINTTDGLFLCGSQLEPRASVSSYINTGAATATRAADVPVVAGADLLASGWRNDRGTWLIDAVMALPGPSYARFFSLGATADDNMQLLAAANMDARAILYVRSGATTFERFSAESPASPRKRVAFGYSAGGYSVSMTGSAASTLAGPIPTLPTSGDLLRLAASPAASDRPSVMWVRSIAYWPYRMTDAQLQALSTLTP